MAVAFDIAYESHTGTSGSANQAFFDTSVAFISSDRGLLVFTFVNADAADALSVKIDPAGANIDVPAVAGGEATDTAGEPGRCKAWFLGAGVPTTTQTVRVNRTNNGNVMYAVFILVTAANNTAVHEAGIVLDQGDGTLAERSVTDGSPGTNSVRFAGLNSGLPGVPGVGASTTASHSIDFGQRVIATCRETTAGQGARNVGFSSGTTDDRAGVYLAVKEVAGNVLVTPSTIALTTSRFAPTVLTPRLVTPGILALTTTQFAPSVVVGTTVTPGVATLTTAQFAPTVLTPRLVTPGILALATTLFAPSVTVGIRVAPVTASLSLVTFAPAVLTPRLVTPGTGALLTALFAPTVSVGVRVIPGLASMIITLFAPTVTASGSGGYVGFMSNVVRYIGRIRHKDHRGGGPN